jgi:hypothetical protein
MNGLRACPPATQPGSGGNHVAIAGLDVREESSVAPHGTHRSFSRFRVAIGPAGWCSYGCARPVHAYNSCRNEDEVDAFLDLVQEELTRLIREKTTLRPPRVARRKIRLSTAFTG